MGEISPGLAELRLLTCFMLLYPPGILWEYLERSYQEWWLLLWTSRN